MTKFFGVVGYAETQDSGDGVWVEKITRRNYYGDVLRNSKRWDTTDHVNDNLSVSNKISIVADPYAYQHFFAIRFVNWMGADWKVTEVEEQRPRLILTLGGVYNGPTDDQESEDQTSQDSV